jgi:predicted GIY-YIG superfamily endonuclease
MGGKSAAAKQEALFKSWTRKKKLAFIEAVTNQDPSRRTLGVNQREES